mmetsp:Transcript_62954/g.198831  ORF Transcript_62954/g.198831 Transcript_62954/m.198831 type:complete len:384 (-) Transcript_62954:777-1928(-)
MGVSRMSWKTPLAANRMLYLPGCFPAPVMLHGDHKPFAERTSAISPTWKPNFCGGGASRSLRRNETGVLRMSWNFPLATTWTSYLPGCCPRPVMLHGVQRPLAERTSARSPTSKLASCGGLACTLRRNLTGVLRMSWKPPETRIRTSYLPGPFPGPVMLHGVQMPLLAERISACSPTWKLTFSCRGTSKLEGTRPAAFRSFFPETLAILTPVSTRWMVYISETAPLPTTSAATHVPLRGPAFARTSTRRPTSYSCVAGGSGAACRGFGRRVVVAFVTCACSPRRLEVDARVVVLGALFTSRSSRFGAATSACEVPEVSDPSLDGARLAETLGAPLFTACPMYESKTMEGEPMLHPPRMLSGCRRPALKRLSSNSARTEGSKDS